jgi:hypothetical protein
MKTRPVLASLVLGSILGFAACGNGDDGTGSGGQVDAAGAAGRGGSGQAGSGQAGGGQGGAAGASQAAALLAQGLPCVPQHLINHGDSLYFTCDKGLYQIPRAGGAAQALWTQQSAGALAVVGDSILVVTAGYDQPSSVFEGKKIGKIALAGGALTVVATVDFPKKTASTMVTGLVVDGDKVFLGDAGSAVCENLAGAVGVMNQDGSNPTQLTADQGCVSSLTLDGDHLYWVDYRASAGGTIRRMPRAGGTVEALITGPSLSQQMVVAPDGVYYLTGAGVGSLNKIPKAGGSPTVISDQVPLNPLLAVGSDVYAFDNEMIRFVGGAGPGHRLGQYTPGYSFLIGVATSDDAAVYGGGAVLSGASSQGGIARTAR